MNLKPQPGFGGHSNEKISKISISERAHQLARALDSCDDPTVRFGGPLTEAPQTVERND